MTQIKNLFRAFLIGVLLIPIVIILLAVIGASSIFLFIGLVRYVKNDIEKDGLKNAKSSKERISSRSRFNNWVRRMGKGD